MMKTWSLRLSLTILGLLAMLVVSPSLAQTTVTVSTPTGHITQELPPEGGPFEIDLPLAANAVNSITVSATDEQGNRASEELLITQISLDSVVVAEVSSTQLSPEEIEELVNEGVIDLEDPENYNVSRFVIVITVEDEPVEVVVHIPQASGSGPHGGEERIPMPSENDPAGRPPPSPRQIVVFEELVPVAGQEDPVSLPGVLIIEGRIKSLKEFFSVRLLLMNTSGIFTLSNLAAQIVLPEGALSSTLPASGTVLFDDILPGDGDTPGQAEREFIVRGDQIGIHDLRVDFGGVLTGPGIPEDEPVPFSGDAHCSLEVKGPPTFEVQVFHPDSIVANESYDLRVDITNTGEMPALYASLDLDVGADMELVHCTVNEDSGDAECERIPGPVTRALGHIYPAQRVSETFEVRSFVTGLVSSCLGMADQNITLQVIVGNKGCMAGHFPALEGVPEGFPTVSVLPAANTTGVSTSSVVTAFFSQQMDRTSITTGENGSFNVYHGSRRVPGTIRFDEIFDRTVAIWQVNDGSTNRLAPNTEYTILLTQEIKNRSGAALYNEWISSFSSTGDDIDDITPPELSLSVEAPVDPNHVLPGQTVRVNAYATDQGSGVARVEARLKDLDIGNSKYELIDQRSVQDGDMPPYIFAIESADLVPGHSYRVLVSAYDAMGNPQDASLTLLIAASADPPTILLPEDPDDDWLQGISLDLTPLETTGGTHLVRYYLDGSSEPVKTIYLRPFNTRLETFELSLGSHSVRAVAEDGLAQHGEDTLDFNLVENPSMPRVDFGSSVDGAVYLEGDSFVVNGNAEDEVGISQVLFYLDEIDSGKSSKSGPIAEGTDPFLFDTTGLSPGDHTIHLVATNALGVTNDATDPESYLEFTVVNEQAGSPPGAPVISSVSPPVDGQVTVSGTSVAGARVDITNETRGFTISVYADANGAYSGILDGESGDGIRVVAIDTSQSPDASEASTAVVPVPPGLLRIEQTPAVLLFDDAGESAQLTVTAFYDDGSEDIVTKRSVFTTSDAGVATVTSSGIVVAHDNGDAVITGSFDGQQDTSDVTVADRTAPEVETTEPEAESRYNFGDTVTIVIEASDAVGVREIRYETSGALDYSESQRIDPPSKRATATFHFDVPYGVEDPEVWIHGFATDTSDNEGAAPAVPIEVTGSDITPPATEAYEATDPGSSPTTTLSYRVSEGLDDLDHVELYFRKDGLGTFNRYTNAPGGNAEGHYHPTGAEGTIPFDSTRMGGDGSFEFYTVGVDQTGNREEAPDDGTKAPAADVSQTIAAGSSWLEISADTFIAASDTSYDGQNLRISGSTVTLEGHHEFQNVELLSASLTHQESNLDQNYSVDLSAWTLSLDASSSINVGGKGYLGGNHEGNECTGQTENGLAGSTYRSGGSHGGSGAIREGTAGPVYDDLTAPVAPGSGGSCGSSSRAGGDGGGIIEIHATNIINDGLIAADGSRGSGAGSGSGAGGSIYLVVSTLSGRGRISTNGGAYEIGGGGGRIAVHFTDINTFDRGLFEAVGGHGSWAAAGNGTVFLKGTDESAGTLVVDGQGSASTFTSLPIPPGYIFDNIILQNNARTLADDLLEVTDSLEVLSGSILTHSTESEAGLRIKAHRVYVDDTSSIDVSARGYRGGRRDGNESGRGLTLGGLPGAEYRAGGSYGGLGGINEGPGSNLVYGDPAEPHALGSGGSQGSSERSGGNGGGRVSIEASGEVHVDGAILAEGQRGSGAGSGSGSGGSIDISTSLLRGSGRIAADGGAYEIGGGGGRVAIRYAYLSTREDQDFDGLRKITAFGGHGSWSYGSAGTVLLHRSDQALGDLYIDDAMANATARNWTPLTHIGFGEIVDLSEDTLTTDGLVDLLPGGLVGIEINPNLDQQETFTILANDETTITVDISGGTRLTDVATIGNRYAGVYRFDNLNFRRGGFLVMGDLLRVEDTLLLDEYGRLTHFDATMDFISKLDLTVGTLEIRETASIDLSARGYLGGLRNGNDCAGQSQGNSDGSIYRSGGSFGGYGATQDGQPGPSYGNLTHPTELGAGGSCGSSSRAGGDGGGYGVIQAEQIVLDGVISAGGASGDGAGAGSGAGGTLRIKTDELSGTGFLRANGAGYELGGGGGRIAIEYETLLLDQSHIEVLGGRGSWAHAGNGTLFLQSHAQSLGDLVVDGHDASTPAASSPIPGGYDFDNIILRGASQVVADDGLDCSGTLRLSGGSILTHSTGSEAGLTIEAAHVEVDEGSAIDVSGRGYRGGYRDGNSEPYGLTLGALPGAEYRAGGSYGGYGGIREGAGNNLPYGHPGAPLYLGSGGSSGSSSRAGGNGGGLVRIDASEGVHITGAIRADGQSGDGAGSGSGSGGSIDIRTALLEGSGNISAAGGRYEIGGGGGRVAISYSDLGAEGQDFSGLRTITALGGHGSWEWGSAGSVLLKRQGDPRGELIIDDHHDGGTSRNWTPLTLIGFGQSSGLSEDTLTTDGTVTMLPNSLVGVEINPNLDQERGFTILSNTETTITVDVSSGTLLTDVAAVGDAYGGVYRFDRLSFRRGGFLVVGDRLLVTDTVLIDEYGRLTHFDATADFSSRLELTAGSIELTATGFIDADGRGYLGGRSEGDLCAGQTLPGLTGSSYRSGGSYGGLGAAHDSGVPNQLYGSATSPADLGSGGSCGSSSRNGGDGGGYVLLKADSITVNGVITAGGLSGGGGGAGSGSGGSIMINVDDLYGTGVIRADGGAYEVGGGGGRVSIVFTWKDLPDENIHAAGGHGSWAAAADGSVHLP